MKAVGGYLPLELNYGGKEGDSAFNLGRSALAALMEVRQYKAIALPRYICKSVIDVMEKLGISITYYSLNESLEPVWSEIPKDGPVLYINYFGVKDNAVQRVAERLKGRLIADLTQAFFYRPPAEVEGFNSVRKFIGVTDGAYLFSDAVRVDDFPRQEIGEEALYLILRADGRVEDGYPLFCEAGRMRDAWDVRRISRFSEAVLNSVDLEQVAARRRKHFQRFYDLFQGVNQLPIESGNAGPLCYPLLVSNGTELKKKLIAEKIFVPTYWPGLESILAPGSVEENMVKNLVCLPVDQHLELEDLERIERTVSRFL